MDSNTFNEIVETQVKRSTDLLVKKADEYATEDRLHNFKVAASLQDCTPAQALRGMLAKHTVSVFDMMNSGKFYPEEVWNEKITDSINYHLLLRALVEEPGGTHESEDPDANKTLYDVNSTFPGLEYLPRDVSFVQDLKRQVNAEEVIRENTRYPEFPVQLTPLQESVVLGALHALVLNGTATYDEKALHDQLTKHLKDGKSENKQYEVTGMNTAGHVEIHEVGTDNYESMDINELMALRDKSTTD